MSSSRSPRLPLACIVQAANALRDDLPSPAPRKRLVGTDTAKPRQRMSNQRCSNGLSMSSPMPEANPRISPVELRDTPCRGVGNPHLLQMRKPRNSSPFALPMMMARLTASSLETIFHRTTMMAMGTCSPAEYRRMVAEKTAAAQHSMAALMTGKSAMKVLAPYSSRASANAKRLRKKK